MNKIKYILFDSLLCGLGSRLILWYKYVRLNRVVDSSNWVTPPVLESSGLFTSMVGTSSFFSSCVVIDEVN